ncbi:MAG: PilT/PilU family type 4a pilus ATPase [Planctomycetes bacterium]|nr:PilT/PilU family type 4a pilus ATPase [Planctomycetota bacterium]MCW8136185.1 PilT/PilU family type 4a pilus ATPase [Planctomycetota bacterium]
MPAPNQPGSNPYLRQPSGAQPATQQGGWEGGGWEGGEAAPEPHAPRYADQGGNAFATSGLMNQLLEIAESEDASDLHLCAGAPPVLRIHGRLVPVEAKVLTPDDTEAALRIILSDRDMERFYEHRAIDCTHTSPDGKSRFRVSAYVQRGAVTVVYRRIPSDVKPFNSLGLPPAAGKLHTLKDGMILCVGPTGCGKSTTLATIIDQINENYNYNIITIEDPIEFVHRHKRSLVNQRELYSDTNTFRDALHFALREDPNVIMVGEMRDLETMRTAITAAETGHLVLSTLHAIDCIATIDRMCAMFPTEEQEYVRMQLSMVLRAVIAQRLMPTKNEDRRVMVAEFMIVTPGIANMIRQGQQALIYQAIETGAQHGMISFDKALVNMARKGLIDPDLAIRQARHQKGVADALGKGASLKT